MTRLALIAVGVAALVAAIAQWGLDGAAAANDANVAWTLAALFAVGGTASAIRRCSPRDLRTWTALAVASGAWLVGQLAWNWFTIDGKAAPVPSIADVLWLVFPVIASFAIYRFAQVPTAVRRVIDLDAIALAVAAGALTLAINWHAFHTSALSTTGRVTTIIYPIMYAALVAIATGGIVGAPEVIRRREVMLVYAGLLGESLGFGLWGRETLTGTFAQGASRLDWFWTCGMLLLGAGGMLVRRDPVEIVYAGDRLRRRTILPAISFGAIACALVVHGIEDKPFVQRLPLLVALCVVGVVLIARCWLAFAAVENLEANRRETLARRNRELEAFAYSASHDLKAPLVSIAGFAAMLERSLGEGIGDEERYYLQRIGANAQGLQTLIADLFAFARAGDDERDAEPVDTNAVAAELLLELRDRAEERGMRLVLDGSLPTVRAHPVRLKQALTNLVDNALRYGGGHVRLSGSRSGDRAEIVVEDGGAGVPPEERDRIFEVFARGEDARRAAPEGTGLGLALVKRIVEASGGDVRYEAGAGARFVLTFPGGAQ